MRIELSKDIQEWVRKTALHEDLQKVTESPVFQEAIRLALGVVERSIDFDSDNLLAVNALAHAESQGAKKIIQTLKQLARPPIEWVESSKEIKPKAPPWSYIKDEYPKSTLV